MSVIQNSFAEKLALQALNELVGSKRMQEFFKVLEKEGKLLPEVMDKKKVVNASF